MPLPHDWPASFDGLLPVVLAAAGSALVLGLAGIAAALMRRASAAARHEVWLLGFAGALLLPVLSFILPGWHVLPLPGTVRDSTAAVNEVVLPPSSDFIAATPTRGAVREPV